MTNFSDLPRSTQSRLAALSARVDGITPIAERRWSITTNSAAFAEECQAVSDEVKEWSQGSTAFIYLFRLRPEYPSLDGIAKIYSDSKAAKVGNRAYARLNRPSTCLYVGSSEKLHQRLKEHFGFGAKGTYALQLQHWAHATALSIQIECARYSATTSTEVLQALEDTLWYLEHPMFGRQGAK